MRRHVFLAACAVGFVAAGIILVQCRAQQAPDIDAAKASGTIDAVGSATVTGKPDSVRLYFGVTTQNEALAVAREENNRAVAKIQAAILALKVPDLKAKTRDLDVSIVHEDRNKNKVVGYEVRHVFSVLVFDPDTEKLGVVAAKIYDVAIQNGANSRGDIEFFKADDTEMQRQAKTKAVENAIGNAQAYAAGAKLRATAVVQISENEHRWSWGGGFTGGFNGGFGALGGAGGGATGPAFIAGNWQVTSQVRVVMKY